jgi:hypothetical protein
MAAFDKCGTPPGCGLMTSPWLTPFQVEVSGSPSVAAAAASFEVAMSDKGWTHDLLINQKATPSRGLR